MDFALLFLLLVAFASLVTLHVALAYLVGRRLGKLRGWLALLALPLTPYFGFKAGLRLRSSIWCLLLLGYLTLLFFATR